MVKYYKEYESQRLGISKRRVLVRGKSESAEKFRQFYKLLTQKNKPENFRQQYAALGFGRGFWTLYRELDDPGGDE